MFKVKKAFVSAVLVLFVSVAQTQAATVSATISWDKKSSNTIKFGKSYRDGGPSKLKLYASDGPQKSGAASGSNAIATLGYYNAINKMKCNFLVFCKPPAKQKHKFSVYVGDKLVARGKVKVKSKRNPKGDVFRLTFSFVADGYSWVGAGKHKVCEKCFHFAQLIGPAPTIFTKPNPVPQPTPEPEVPAVPLPPTVFLLLSTILGMFGIGKNKKRKKNLTTKPALFAKSPSLFYTGKG
ncbi:MAG: hypothetical protein ACU0CA_09380 [Paracoccaceae bacterium]